MERRYRVRTNINEDKVVRVNLKQDFDVLDILSLNISQEDAYKLQTSNYGVIVGRVLGNETFGIENAKVSVFVNLSDEDRENTNITSIYPYASVKSEDENGIRYNLLPQNKKKECYQNVGTFPSKRLLLDNETVLEVFDKYWKYTTVTNSAGDYMIFGVPTGSQNIHVDVDLSDIGILSQKPRDFEYKGYNINLFKSPNEFNKSEDLGSLAQIFSQDIAVNVYPFFGNTSDSDIAITRADIQIQYKFEPTCVFLGSSFSDNYANAINYNCFPAKYNGYNSKMVAGTGTIEMIRKTLDGKTEQIKINGDQVIDSDGVWCYQIPMNLDYVSTDEYGNIVPSESVGKGIPTRTRVRFRISMQDNGDEAISRHRGKILVPNNPELDENNIIPVLKFDKEGVDSKYDTYKEKLDSFYEFGSNTPENCYRDLLWNKVYSVKSYIPRFQKSYKAKSAKYSGIRTVNALENNLNPMPYNTIRIKLPFNYRILCVLLKMVLTIVNFINSFVVTALNVILSPFRLILLAFKKICDIKLGFLGHPFRKLPICKAISSFDFYIPCLKMDIGITDSATDKDSDGYEDNNYMGSNANKEGDAGMQIDTDDTNCPDSILAPGCKYGGTIEGEIWNKGGHELKKAYSHCDNDVEIVNKLSVAKELVEVNLGEKYDIFNLDFNNDWLNGSVYLPLWMWKVKQAKNYLFGLIHKKSVNTYCSCDKKYKRLRLTQLCNLKYIDDDFTNPSEDYGNKNKKSNWHNNLDGVALYNGVIKTVTNNEGLKIYYYSAGNISGEDGSFIRLFATDIILLGSFNDCDIDGIPSVYMKLPQTTANIPEFEPTSMNVEKTNDSTDEDEGQMSKETEEQGMLYSSGMDWGAIRTNVEDTGWFYFLGPNRSSISKEYGLFADIGCSTISTLPKTCINASRICELSVSPDTSFYLNGANATDNSTPTIYDRYIRADGMINKIEIDSNDTRAMFATLNFNKLLINDTTVNTETNGYNTYDLRYIYPTDFDGRLSNSMENGMGYRNQKSGGIKKMHSDEKNEDYILFRMGDNRHFYKYGRTSYSMPLYENSFYFYFGINEGNTAIDKFNKMFYSECENSNGSANVQNDEDVIEEA